MKIIWNEIEHKKNTVPSFSTNSSHRALPPNVILGFFFFPSGRAWKKTFSRIRIITLSICQIDKVWHHWVIFGWFSSYTGSFSRKAVKWSNSGKAERTVRRKADLQKGQIKAQIQYGFIDKQHYIHTKWSI